MTRKTLAVLIGAAGLTAAWAAKTGILHPEMAVESGSWDKPAATLGTKPDQPATISAGVDNKPQPVSRSL